MAKGSKRKAGGNIRALIGWAGRVGWRGCVSGLSGKKGIRSPERLCGYLKGRAKKAGRLSRSHAYGKGK